MPPEPRYRQGNCHDCYPATDPRVNSELASSLKGQNVLVTGAGRGIGRAIALFLTHASARSLTICALEQDEIDETAKLCKAINPELLTLSKSLNVTDSVAVQNLVQEALEKFGSIDVLVCNAGRPPQWLPLSESEPSIWWDTVCVSFQHSFLFTRFALPSMQARKQGCIIYTSSSGAHATFGMGSYSLGKLAQVRLAEIIHDENFERWGIRSFAFNPGAVKTRFFTDFEDVALGKKSTASGKSYVEDGVEGQEKSANTAYSILKDAHFDTPELAAGLVTVLASGKLDFMSGRYVDATVDVDEYLKSEEATKKYDLHKVKLHNREDQYVPAE